MLTNCRIRVSISLLLLVFSSGAQPLELIAHRGILCGLPENSVEAIGKVWGVGGIEGVEIDVRVSKDGVVYVFHDDRIESEYVPGMTYDEVVSRVGEAHAPRLESALVAGETVGTYIIDLKPPWDGNVDALINTANASGLTPQQIVFQSDDLRTLASIRSKMPNASYLHLNKLKRQLPFFRAPTANDVIDAADRRVVDGVSLKGRQFLNAGYVERLKASGLKVYIWTINDRDRFEHYAGLGVDGLITDEALAFSGRPNSASVCH